LCCDPGYCINDIRADILLMMMSFLMKRAYVIQVCLTWVMIQYSLQFIGVSLLHCGSDDVTCSWLRFRCIHCDDDDYGVIGAVVGEHLRL
jgi:hypothetical protein